MGGDVSPINGALSTIDCGETVSQKPQNLTPDTSHHFETKLRSLSRDLALPEIICEQRHKVSKVFCSIFGANIANKFYLQQYPVDPTV